MRELKFRVWNLSTKAWSAPLFISPSGVRIVSICLDEDNYVYSQYTGRLDKNGNEICERDILSVKSFDSWSDKIGFYYKAIVYYDPEDACFRYSFYPALGGHRFERPRISGVWDIEVVGNIHEHPHLMREAKLSS